MYSARFILRTLLIVALVHMTNSFPIRVVLPVGIKNHRKHRRIWYPQSYTMKCSNTSLRGKPSELFRIAAIKRAIVHAPKCLTLSASTIKTPTVHKLNYKKLVDAEEIRQDGIQQLVNEYLTQYPDVHRSYAESLFQDECKAVVVKVVAQMMSDKRVAVKHFEEAFAFYDWLAAHEPAPVDDPSGMTLLHRACLHGRSDVLAVLLGGNYKPRITAQDKKGHTPFHTAALGGQLECLKLICDHAPESTDLCDFSGRTALMVAAAHNQQDVVKHLLECGANQVLRDANKETATDIAKKQGHSEVVKILRAHQHAQSFQHATVVAQQRWLSAPMHRRLYDAWQASPAPHTNVPVDNILFEVAAPHTIEAANIELVRTNRFNAAMQRNYFTKRTNHNELFLTLAYLATPSVCSIDDCRSTLARYEALLKISTELVEVHPLYFLACARLAKDDLPLRKALLNDFVKKYPTTLGLTAEKGGWLSREEAALLNGDFFSTMVTEEPLAETIQDRWKKLADGANLTTHQRAPMDELLKLTGLTTVKELAIDLYIEAQEIAKGTVSKNAPREYNFAFLGNPGTGKTTVARILARILEASGLRAGNKVIEMTASDALRKGVMQFNTELAALTGGDGGIGPPVDAVVFRKGMQVEVKHQDKWYPGKISKVNKGGPVLYDILYPDGTEDTDIQMFKGNEQVVRVVSKETTAGGVLFLDEAYDLDPANLREGRHIMADIMKAAENSRDKVSIILAGYKDDIENKLYANNDGMRDRFSAVHFDDFSEDELREVWLGMCKTAGWTEVSLPGQMSVSRIAARRLFQRQSVKGFANARSVRVLVNQSITAAKRRPGHNKMLIVEDVIDVPPTPTHNPALAAALHQLDQQIGIRQVKHAVHSLCEVARCNYDKELNGMKTDRIQLNRLFLGNPGTGKTTVAAIYGAILKNLQLLSKGDVIERKASDFIGAVIGGTEEKTKGILQLAKGCVLIIDEAYNLNDQQFGKIALNTIVENVNNAPGDDIAVIMIGYEKNMLAMLNEQNPGLRSRFDPTYAFHFDDFSDMELLQIFSSACNKDQLAVPIELKVAAVKHLTKARSMKNFGNARAVLQLLGAAKSRMNYRIQQEMHEGLAVVEGMTLEDILGEDVALTANPLQFIDELQGGDDEHGFRTVLRQLGNSISVCRLENRPVDPVGNFIFTGAPGTGKTTVASKMAKMLNAFGVLASDHVVITSALDLTGEYVGQSKKVIEGKMEEARGGVLFIDEAYKLGEGVYGEEVMVKLLGMLTEPEYNNGKTIVILAGYQSDMDRMLSRNAGMASRFNEYINFADWSAEQCADFVEHLGKRECPLPFHFSGDVKTILQAGFRQLLQRPNWANARDSESMYKYLKKSRDRRRGQEVESHSVLFPQAAAESALLFTDEDAQQAVATFLRTRPVSSLAQDTVVVSSNEPPRQQEDSCTHNNNPHDATSATATATATCHHQQQATTSLDPSDADGSDRLDGDGSADGDGACPNEAGAGGERQLSAAEKAQLQRATAAYTTKVQADAAELLTLQSLPVTDVDTHTQQRMEELTGAALEAKKQELLLRIGKCRMGFVWQKVPGGYQCEGGAHFMSDDDVIQGLGRS